jgi:hypothetical protein
LALAEAVGPECGVCLDAFHLNIEEADMLAAIRRAGKRLFDFHVADNNRLACGMGSLNWSAIIRTLKDIGYDGAVTVEFVAPVDRTPANPFPQRGGKEPGQHQPRTAQVYRRSRLQPAQRRVLRLAGRTLRTGSAAAKTPTRPTRLLGWCAGTLRYAQCDTPRRLSF